MKNKVIGILTLIAGALIAIGPQILFKVCDTDGDMVMKCFYTSRVVLGIGIEIAVLALIQLLQKHREAIIASNIAILLNGIFTIVVTDLLIGVCNNPHMRCHSLTKPALNILGVVVIILAVVGIRFAGSKTAGNGDEADGK
ncbi:MAG: DUF4418 family protein [Lachnospiraceae bacterium]|nr:DUF4418 family protein [Lachnospiraceae bacterium]